MRILRRLCTAAPACFVVLAVAGSGPAAADTIVRGTVKGARGYTLNGTAAGGQVVARRLGRSGAFVLRFRGRAGRGASLHLIRPNGRYFGPVVLARRGRRAFVALSGRSVRLGRIVLRRGYATPRAAPSRRALSATAVRADARGRPLGAGRLGLVAGARRAQSAQAGGGRPAGEDPDRDGVASAYDADDDGDLTLDAVDTGARASGAGLFSTLFLGFTDALNANAGATRAQIDGAFSGENQFGLVFYFDGGQFSGRTVSGAHVDCFALVYCRRGSGTAVLTGVSESSPSLPRGSRWTDFSPDGSGYPNLERISSGGRPAFVAGVQPRVTTSQITPGDTYNVVFGTNAGPLTLPTTLSSYFVTTPAITAYSSGAGTTSLAYPIAPGSVGCCGAGEGSPGGNPVPMSSDRLTLTFWRPQRAAIPGAETGSFRDMGHLRYGVVPGGEGIAGEPSCAGHYSGLSPTLSAESPSEQGPNLFPLLDSADDEAPDPARTLSFTVDVGACLRAAGVPSTGRTVKLTLTAASAARPGGQDRAAQSIAVRLPG